jgi:phosphate transport system protein
VRAGDLDELEDSVFRDVPTHMMEDPRNISFSAHLLFSLKNIERIGDHATNIAETVVYLVSGRSMPPERPHSRPDTDANINIDAAGGDL